MKRPSFKKTKQSQAYASPEDLFGKLPDRAKSHGYLRAPQVDAMRMYERHKEKPDIAMELPTGTGKTAVGLIIAEWNRRLSGNRAAYLTLTNQLAKQVMEEASALGIECADLRGSKNTRVAADVGRYQSGSAIGVSTYPNLFNVNPVIQESEILILDDAHGGEGYVSGMWTVLIESSGHRDTYDEVLAILRPSLSDEQYRMVTDGSHFRAVELADVNNETEILPSLTNILDTVEDSSIRFPWSLIRNNLESCLILVSLNSIVIRPIVPPTHTHEKFSNSRQRIYMSATLGGSGDLKRAYGIANIQTIHAQNPQWGSRYIFAPGLYLENDEVGHLVGELWSQLQPRRILMLAPSFSTEQRVRSELLAYMKPAPVVFSANDVEESLEQFTGRENVMLSMAGRYDGLDLPGDDCRFLILAETPGAVDALEQHQKEHWKLGPLLRRRERTRLIQGMGRCTRDATDFAVIILLGQSIIDSLTNKTVVRGLPEEIQRELVWGLEQSQTGADDLASLVEMIIGLLDDSQYRKEANESLGDVVVPDAVEEPESFEQGAKGEVKYSRALWSGNFSTAFEVAKSATDEIIDTELSGYRAWWFYLAAHAARLQDDRHAEIDCLKRARAIGINSGFLDRLLRKRTAGYSIGDVGEATDIQVERIWNCFDDWGWNGPKFQSEISAILANIRFVAEPEKFHMGIEALGSLLGAETTRPQDRGAPDVIWIYAGQCFVFEAKSDKSSTSSLNKKEIQQANGHRQWLKSERPDLTDIPMQPIIVSPVRRFTDEAKPHIGSLAYISTDDLAAFAESAAAGAKAIRAEFAGKEYAEAAESFKVQLNLRHLLLESVSEVFSARLSAE